MDDRSHLWMQLFKAYHRWAYACDQLSINFNAYPLELDFDCVWMKTPSE